MDYDPNNNFADSGQDEQTAASWESGSQLSASVVSSSSVWTEGSNTDRSSRRALILQMAKARMKSNKDHPSSPQQTNGTIAEEQSHQNDESFYQEPTSEAGGDIDFTGDLD